MLLPITDQYHSLIQKVSFLKDLYLNTYTITYETIIYYLLFSPALYQEIPVNQLTYLYDTFCLALDSGKEARAVFVTSAKLLTESSMMG